MPKILNSNDNSVTSCVKGEVLAAGTGTLSMVERCVIAFAKKIGRLSLGDVVIDLYDSSLEESSRNQYSTGQRAYLRFMLSGPATELTLPFPQTPLRETELSLAFFMATLVLKPTIKVGSTVLSYETHVKWMFRKEGCHPGEYRTPFLRQIRRGVRKMLPSRRDMRAAFLLPRWVFTPTFTDADSKSQYLVRFATVIGFVGMLRPHTFSQLQPLSFTLIVRGRNP